MKIWLIDKSLIDIKSLDNYLFDLLLFFYFSITLKQRGVGICVRNKKPSWSIVMKIMIINFICVKKENSSSSFFFSLEKDEHFQR